MKKKIKDQIVYDLYVNIIFLLFQSANKLPIKNIEFTKLKKKRVEKTLWFNSHLPVYVCEWFHSWTIFKEINI